MNHDLRKYKKRILILCIMLAVVLVTSGISYAVFTGYSTQTDTNTLAATCIDFEFNGTNEINLTNSYPISDSKGLEQTPYIFTIKNKCDNYIEYYVVASVINTSTSAESKYIKVSLLGDNDMNPSVITSLKQISTPQSLSSYNIKENYILKERDGITKNESRTFNFRMWLDANNESIWTTESLENKTYQVKISVIGTVKAKPVDDLFASALIDGKESLKFPTTSKYTASVECTRNGKKIDANESITWNGTEWELNAKITNGNVRCNATFETTEQVTLRDAILTNNEISTPITTPGEQEAASYERVLAETKDDYGTSYYFRGKVDNNYVQFANMCWRIVRITGDGSVKLVLHNNNLNNVADPCTSGTGSVTAYAAYDGDTYMSFFNESNNDNAYIGFMYGATGATNYATTHANINKSTILTNLETWYEKNLSSYESKLADTIWCNDKSTTTGVGYGTNSSTYAAYNRIITTKKPSLICPNDNNGGKLSKFTVSDTTNGNGALTYKIGLLTADEVAFAGSYYGDFDDSGFTYLYENATNEWWWTMSPMSFGSQNTYLIFDYAKDHLGYNYVMGDGTGAIRPAVSLKSTVIATGDGSSGNPYIIK